MSLLFDFSNTYFTRLSIISSRFISFRYSRASNQSYKKYNDTKIGYCCHKISLCWHIAQFGILIMFIWISWDSQFLILVFQGYIIPFVKNIAIISEIATETIILIEAINERSTYNELLPFFFKIIIAPFLYPLAMAQYFSNSTFTTALRPQQERNLVNVHLDFLDWTNIFYREFTHNLPLKCSYFFILRLQNYGFYFNFIPFRSLFLHFFFIFCNFAPLFEKINSFLCKQKQLT